MKQEVRTPFDRALERARHAAFPPGEFVGQESFMQAGEVRRLAVRAGIGPGVSVLDLCCGVAGPGRFISAELGCDYLGVDASPDAVALARERAGDLPCRFEVGRVPPLPVGRFDVVLLLETLLAFEDPEPLLGAVGDSLVDRGRFACTVEEGEPLTPAERDAMPDADTVWLLPLPRLLRAVEDSGMGVLGCEDVTEAHRATAAALTDAFVDDRDAIIDVVGPRAWAELVQAHRLWTRWLGSGRVRKLALVAQKLPAGEPGGSSRRISPRDPSSPDDGRTTDGSTP